VANRIHLKPHEPDSGVGIGIRDRKPKGLVVWDMVGLSRHVGNIRDVAHQATSQRSQGRSGSRTDQTPLDQLGRVEKLPFGA
jgi:hypothetical protein